MDASWRERLLPPPPPDHISFFRRYIRVIYHEANAQTRPIRPMLGTGEPCSSRSRVAHVSTHSALSTTSASRSQARKYQTTTSDVRRTSGQPTHAHTAHVGGGRRQLPASCCLCHANRAGPHGGLRGKKPGRSRAVPHPRRRLACGTPVASPAPRAPSPTSAPRCGSNCGWPAQTPLSAALGNIDQIRLQDGQPDTGVRSPAVVVAVLS